MIQRPSIITFVAGIQLFRATVALVIAAMLFEYPNFDFVDLIPVRALAYLATHSGLQNGKLGALLLTFSVAYLAATGIGLIGIQKWARRSIQVGTGFTIALWIKYAILSPLMDSMQLDGAHPVMVFPPFQKALILTNVALDMILFGCLTLYPDVDSAFEKRR